MRDKRLPRLVFGIHFAQIIIGSNYSIFQLRPRRIFNAFPQINYRLVGGNQLLELIDLRLLLLQLRV